MKLVECDSNNARSLKNYCYNCGVYMLYYMDFTATNTRLSEKFIPDEYRMKIYTKNQIVKLSLVHVCIINKKNPDVKLLYNY